MQDRFPGATSEFFLLESTFSGDTLAWCLYTAVCNPVIHVRVRWIMETESTTGEIPMGQYSYENKIKSLALLLLAISVTMIHRSLYSVVILFLLQTRRLTQNRLRSVVRNCFRAYT